MPAPGGEGVRRRFGRIVRESSLYRSVVRTPHSDTPLGRAQRAFGNVFLHVYPVRVPETLLRLRSTWGTPRKRHFPRRRQGYRVRLCFGFEDVCQR